MLKKNSLVRVVKHLEAKYQAAGTPDKKCAFNNKRGDAI